MSFGRYISHPAKTENGEPTLLIGRDGRVDDDGHLQTVADRMMEVCRGQHLADGTSLQTVSKVIGLTHDFTKLTRWAQKHLRGHSFQQSDTYRYHSFSSSLVTLYCLSECIDDVSDHAAEVATLVVAGHHDISSPPEPSKLASRYGKTTVEVQGRYKRVKAQFDDIDTNAPKRANRIIHTATAGSGSWDAFRDWHKRRTDPIDGVHDHLEYFAKVDAGPTQDSYYRDVLTLWTALKFADQTAASGLVENDFNIVRPELNDLIEHIQGLDDGRGVLAELNALRNQARATATQNVTSLVDSDEVGLITLPTGFGKTYAGLSAGLRAAEINDSRLVYILPYTSIIDQTAREIQSIFNVTPYTKAFTLHHHLADTYTGLRDAPTDADIGRSPGALHAESWLSGLTLTTTVQLFESLTAPTARQATRLPSLQEAVIVIDEPQAIPDSWWQIVPKLVEILVERYDATVILMTATQPGIIKYGSDAIRTRELVDDSSQYIDFLAENPRVTYFLDETVQRQSPNNKEAVNYSTAGLRVLEATNGGGDVLAICNTRASAMELYQHVTSQPRGDETPPVELGQLIHEQVATTGTLPTPVKLRQLALDTLGDREANTLYAYLSGDVRPDDRALIIDALYDDEEGDTDDPDPLLDYDVSVILVSTSVVEAGVDISFDTVFRDFAPIPNVVQSGGRCNRSFGDTTGSVVIWRLAEPEGGHGLPSLVIHGGDGGDALPLLRETGRVLRGHATDDGTIDEATMVSDLVEDFYASLFDGQLEPGDERLPEALDKALMSELAEEHMIDDIEGYEDVVACLTNQERNHLLAGDLDASDLSTYPGAQVSTNPEKQNRTVTVGNSSYVVLDARGSSYHPVFGVK